MNDQLRNELNEMIGNSKSEIRRIEGDQAEGHKVVKELGLNENTTLAAVISCFSGLTIGKLIRILGQGNSESQSICEINNVVNGIPNTIRGTLIAATDIFGGMYAMNVEAFDAPAGQIFYFAPDTLDWEPLGMKYSQFLYWALNGDTDKFYDTMKWNGWEQYADMTKFDQGILIYPFLWSKEVKIETASKNIVPFVELINVNMEYRRKFFE